MAVREYQCRLFRLRGHAFAPATWEVVGELLPARIDLGSTPSKLDALLFAMRQNRGYEGNIEKYRLGLLDGSGTVFHTIFATAQELQAHQAGYPVSASGYAESGAGWSGSLAGVPDEELIAELRRRLAARSPGC